MKRFKLFVFLVAFFGIKTLTLYAAGLKVNRLFISNHGVFLSLKSYVADAIRLDWILNQNIGLHLKYHIRLFQKRGGIGGNIIIAQKEISYHVKEDLINDGYEIRVVNDGKEKFHWTSNKKSLYTFIFTTLPVYLSEEKELNPQGEYYVRFNLDITSLELYPPLSIIYNLMGKWSYFSPKFNSRVFKLDNLMEN